MTFVPGSPLFQSLPVDSLARSVGQSLPGKAELDGLRAAVDARMRAYLAEGRAEYLRQPVFATLYDDLMEFVCRPGKRLRPLLFLLAHRVFAQGREGAGEDSVDEHALFSIGASLEFLTRLSSCTTTSSTGARPAVGSPRCTG